VIASVLVKLFSRNFKNDYDGYQVSAFVRNKAIIFIAKAVRGGIIFYISLRRRES
jgi:hypothetical protein